MGATAQTQTDTREAHWHGQRVVEEGDHFAQGLRRPHYLIIAIIIAIAIAITINVAAVLTTDS